MTLSTLNVAAQSADAAIEFEKSKLALITADEQKAEQALNGVQAEIQRLRGVEQDWSNHLAEKGRDRAAQEQRIKQAEEALREQAEALLKTMAMHGLEAPRPVPQPAETAPDALGVGEVAASGPSNVYNQQVAEQGPPPDLTQPFAAVHHTSSGQLVADHPGGSPAEPQTLERVSETESPSGAHQVARTGEQPKRGSRRG